MQVFSLELVGKFVVSATQNVDIGFSMIVAAALNRRPQRCPMRVKRFKRKTFRNVLLFPPGCLSDILAGFCGRGGQVRVLKILAHG